MIADHIILFFIMVWESLKYEITEQVSDLKSNFHKSELFCFGDAQ
jgi:hypothetical protein